MNNLAIIIARGGSKRIPRKNIKNFCGQPIIAYSIKAALESNCFNTVMCSTDDMEIAEKAKEYGAEIPFMRSEASSNDYATTADVLTEVIEEYKKMGKRFDYFCCIYPTAPFVNAEKLRQGYQTLIATKADAAMPVVRFSYPIQRALVIRNSHQLEMIHPENINARSQDLEQTYHDAGQYYWYRTKAFEKEKNIMLLKAVAIITPESQVQDIDTEEDWNIAEIKFQTLSLKD